MKRALAVSMLVLASLAAAISPAAAQIDPAKTPGSVDPSVTRDAACASEAASAAVPAAVKAQVFKAYGVSKARQKSLTIDRLIPSSLGGTTEMTNLWPASRREVGAKRAQESSSREVLCTGLVDLASAQQAFVADWSTAKATIAANQAAIESFLGGLKSAEDQRNAQELDQYLRGLKAEEDRQKAARSVPAACGNGTYVNSQGNTVCSPYASPGGAPAGATAQCSDGTYSFSQSRSGTCSGHGGVSRWL